MSGLDVIVEFLQRVINIYNEKLVNDKVFTEKTNIFMNNVNNVDFLRDKDGKIIVKSGKEGILATFLRFYTQIADIDIPIIFYIRDVTDIKRTKESLATFLDAMRKILSALITSRKPPKNVDVSKLTPGEALSMIDLPSIFSSIMETFGGDETILETLHDQITLIKTVGDDPKVKPLVSLKVRDVDRDKLREVVNAVEYVVRKIMNEILPELIKPPQ